ncbi:MAG: hypothetical protein H0T53_11900 [Herpetosiphonaceae bacterium]|nr:hypothetical protein [Herpetosiphonaceae bacterium]
MKTGMRLIVGIAISSLLATCGPEYSSVQQSTLIIPTSIPTEVDYPTLVIVPAPSPAYPRPYTSDFPLRWLDGIPCTPPCWEGITPGITDAETAIRQLYAIPIINTSTITTYNVRNTTDMVIGWEWVMTDSEHDAGYGSMYYDGADLLQRITNVRPLYESDDTIALGALIARYGEPAWIKAHAFQVHGPEVLYSLAVIYQTYGLQIEQGGLAREPITIDDAVTFNEITFYPVPFTAPITDPKNGIWKPWEGMKDFGYYCDGVDPTLCPPSAYK